MRDKSKAHGRGPGAKSAGLGAKSSGLGAQSSGLRAEGRGLQIKNTGQHAVSQPGASVHSSSPQPLAISPESVTVLGFDYGAKRIGVAVGNALTGARALEVISNSDRGPDWQRIQALLREWHPGAVLIGLPLTMDGEEQTNSRGARAFAAELEQRFALRIHLVDERLSSHAAASRFAARRASGQARRKHAQTLDAVAAEIIIESWLTQSTPPMS